MRDLSRAKSDRRIDADGTSTEDNRQLTELLLSNKVSLDATQATLSAENQHRSFVIRVKAGAIVLVALPLSIFAYFFSRIPEDDFYV